MKFPSKSTPALVVIIFALIAIIYNLNKFSAISDDLTAAENELLEINEQVLHYNDIKKDSIITVMNLNNVLRGNSENYRANTALLYLSPGNQTAEFTIYNKLDVPAYYRVLSQDVTEGNYATKICGDIKIETDGFSNHEAVIKVTSGFRTGYNIIQFANRKTDEKFYVLVMVCK